MDNLEIYNKVREVPEGAQKKIVAGRIKGMTDINPMWRIKALTETFGPCGLGWYTEVISQWLEPGEKEVKAFVNINLYVKYGDEWSKPIFGTGGSSFISSERNGVYVSDECYKMAYTDALSVACKALGVGADVYWDRDESKYSSQQGPAKSDTGKDKKKDLSKDIEAVKLGVKTYATKANIIEEKITAALLKQIKAEGKAIESLTEKQLKAAEKQLEHWLDVLQKKEEQK